MKKKIQTFDPILSLVCPCKVAGIDFVPVIFGFFHICFTKNVQKILERVNYFFSNLDQKNELH